MRAGRKRKVTLPRHADGHLKRIPTDRLPVLKNLALVAEIDGGDKCGVYVICPDEGGPCKIGVSGNPAERLLFLQCGNWVRLKVAVTFWFGNEALAFGIENECHKAITKEGRALNGEWFDLTLGQAKAKILEVSGMIGAKQLDADQIRAYSRNTQSQIMN